MRPLVESIGCFMDKKKNKSYFLCLDIGNTRSKVAIFDPKSNQLRKLWIWDTIDKKKLLRILLKYKIAAAIVSSVNRPNPRLLKWLRKRLQILVDLNHKTPLPITNAYLTPETLGKDRLANAVGAWSLGEKSVSTLIIDAGTCVKYDFLQENNSYLGGVISLGLQMRAKALQHFTARLPLVEPFLPPNPYGRNTQEAMNLGIVKGLVAEINHFHQHYSHLAGDNIKVILTGGDINFLQTWAEFPNVSEPNLVLIGLHQILKYNVENYQ